MADEVLQRHAPLMEFTRSSKAWGFHPTEGIKEYDEDELVEHFNMKTGESDGVVIQGMEKKNYFKYSQDVLKNHGWNIDEMYKQGGNSNFPDDDGGKIYNDSSSEVSIKSKIADLDDGEYFCVWGVVRRTYGSKSKLKIGERNVASKEHRSVFTFEDKKIVDVSKHDKHKDAGYIELVNDFYIIYASWKVGDVRDDKYDKQGGINFSEGDGFDVAHMQAENSPYPTSPICTDGSTKTRAKDKAKFPHKLNKDVKSGTMIAEFTFLDYGDKHEGIWYVNRHARLSKKHAKVHKGGLSVLKGTFGKRQKGVVTFNVNNSWAMSDQGETGSITDRAYKFNEGAIKLAWDTCALFHNIQFLDGKVLSEGELEALSELNEVGK